MSILLLRQKKSPQQDIVQFHTIIDNAIVVPKYKLKFLGDDLCDRGMNDYYTLNVFKKLDESGVSFDIILSNHGSFFLGAYENFQQSFGNNPYGNGKNEDVVRSMLNLEKIIENDLVSRSAVLGVIRDNYLKHMSFPGVVIDKKNEEITIYSHAPVDIAMLLNLAKDLNIVCDDTDLVKLNDCFQRINQKIATWIKEKSFTQNYKNFDVQYKTANSLSPLRQVIWNRNYEILNREYEPEGKSYKVNYVHGHDSQPNVFNLDNLFGKGDDNDRGPYAVHTNIAN